MTATTFDLNELSVTLAEIERDIQTLNHRHKDRRARKDFIGAWQAKTYLKSLQADKKRVLNDYITAVMALGRNH